jgi:hypothetical protein
MIGYILFLVAVIVGVILYPIGIIYGALKMAVLYVGAILKTFAVGISQFGNVACSELFNDTLIKKNGIKFGNPDNTISKVLGLNKKAGTLTKTGLFVADLLNKIDNNHVENSAE